jgi:Zn-dependent protease
VEGLPYALTLLVILFAHRFGYYIVARHNMIPASLPLFWPGTPKFLGGGGAFIRIYPNSIDRKTLFEISVSGTIMGFLVATLSMIIGLYLSTIVPRENISGLQLGEPLLLKGLS